MRDLVVLVPDKNTEYVVRGGLGREESLGIRAVDFQIVVDPGRGGVRRRGVQILAAQKRQFTHAVLMFDYDGSGAEDPAAKLEDRLDDALSNMWGTHAKAIVIEPETSPSVPKRRWKPFFGTPRWPAHRATTTPSHEGSA